MVLGLVLVVLVGGVIAGYLLNDRDNGGQGETGTSLPGEEFADPQGTYKLNVDPEWTPNHGALAAEIELWMVGEPSTDFAPNVNVLTQAAANLDLRSYVDLSMQQGSNLIEGFTLVDDQIVEGATRQELGIMEYTGTETGRDLHFLAVFFVENNQAVVATYTGTEDQFASQGASVESFLRTLRPT